MSRAGQSARRARAGRLARLAAMLWLALLQPALACDAPPALPALRAELLALTNAARQAQGLAALAPDPRLDAAAQAQACRTAARGRLSHRGSWFAGLGRRLRRVGYGYAMAAENLAEGHATARQVHRDWLTSPRHRRNTLDPRARQVGFGVARAEGGRLHWTMILAAPVADLGG